MTLLVLGAAVVVLTVVGFRVEGVEGAVPAVGFPVAGFGLVFGGARVADLLSTRRSR